MAKHSDFLAGIAALAAEYRRRIEAECDGFDIDPAASAARRVAVNDAVTGFEFFLNTYFPHYVRSPHKSELHHYLFVRLPQVVAADVSQNDAIAAPRGEAKSTLVTQLFTLWCVMTGRKRYGVIVMDSIDQSYPMLEAIKAELEYNPRLSADFPDAVGQGRVWQAGSILTANGAKLQVAGSGKKLRGLRHGALRPDLVILDDIENDEQVRSPDQRDKTDNWVKKTVMQLGGADDKCDVIWIGTVLHHDSVLNRTLNNPMWHTARFKAMIAWPHDMAAWDKWEEILRNDGPDVAQLYYLKNEMAMLAGAQVSWSARPVLKLMKIRARDGHDTFDSEYQNNPTEGVNAIFAGCINFWVNRLNEWVFYGAVDPSLGKQGRDPSAILVGGYNRNTGILDVVEASIKKRLPDRIIEDVIALHKQYRCAIWAVETVQFQEFLKTELVKRSAIQGLAVPARAVKPVADKGLRIESLQPHMANGLIRLNPAHVTLIDQLRHFPKADHDDGPDALHMLWALVQSGAGVMEYQSEHTRGRMAQTQQQDNDDEYSDSRSTW
jgi:predicted phage terminase large subunit-like protein